MLLGRVPGYFPVDGAAFQRSCVPIPLEQLGLEPAFQLLFVAILLLLDRLLRVSISLPRPFVHFPSAAVLLHDVE